MALTAGQNNPSGTVSHNTLKIIEINVNSLITNERRASLADFLETHNPDVVLLCETKLNIIVITASISKITHSLETIDRRLNRLGVQAS